MASAIPRVSPSRPADGGRRRVYLAAVIAVLGAVAVAHPVYLWPHYGQTHVGMAVTVASDPAEPGVAAGTLPPAAREPFQAAAAGDPVDLWTGEDDRVIETFEDRSLVRYRGETYRVVLFYDHPGSFLPVALRWLLTAAGAFAIAYAGLVLHARSWRPLTPRRALWVPVAVATGFFATAAYDVTASGAAGSVARLSGLGPGVELLLLVPITAVFVVAGSAVTRNGWQSRTAAAAALGALLLAHARFPTGFNPTSVVVLTGYTALGGLGWAVVGAVLTRPAGPDRDRP